MGFNFDKTVNLGHILTFGGFLAVAFGLGVTLKTDINTLAYETKNLTERLSSFERNVDKMTDVLVTLGKYDVRIDGLDKRLTILENPPPLVVERPAPGRRR